MTFHPADSFSLSVFSIFSVAMLSLIFASFRKAKVPHKHFTIFCAFTMVASLLAVLGITSSYVLPTVPLIFVTLVALAVWFAFGSPGEKIAARFSFAALVGFQSFRLLLELILHHWAAIGTIPPTMTWTGKNFDVITGIAALIVLPFANKSRAAVWAFQILGFGLLLNVVRVVVLSSPFPFSWQLENPLQLVLYFPYVLIGPLFVWPALFGHLALFRKIKKAHP